MADKGAEILTLQRYPFMRRDEAEGILTLLKRTKIRAEAEVQRYSELLSRVEEMDDERLEELETELKALSSEAFGSYLYPLHQRETMSLGRDLFLWDDLYLPIGSSMAALMEVALKIPDLREAIATEQVERALRRAKVISPVVTFADTVAALHGSLPEELQNHPDVIDAWDEWAEGAETDEEFEALLPIVRDRFNRLLDLREWAQGFPHEVEDPLWPYTIPEDVLGEQVEELGAVLDGSSDLSPKVVRAYVGVAVYERASKAVTNLSVHYGILPDIASATIYFSDDEEGSPLSSSIQNFLQSEDPSLEEQLQVMRFLFSVEEYTPDLRHMLLLPDLISKKRIRPRPSRARINTTFGAEINGWIYDALFKMHEENRSTYKLKKIQRIPGVGEREVELSITCDIEKVHAFCNNRPAWGSGFPDLMQEITYHIEEEADRIGEPEVYVENTELLRMISLSQMGVTENARKHVSGKRVLAYIDMIQSVRVSGKAPTIDGEYVYYPSQPLLGVMAHRVKLDKDGEPLGWWFNVMVPHAFLWSSHSFPHDAPHLPGPPKTEKEAILRHFFDEQVNKTRKFLLDHPEKPKAEHQVSIQKLYHTLYRPEDVKTFSKKRLRDIRKIAQTVGSDVVERELQEGRFVTFEGTGRKRGRGIEVTHIQVKEYRPPSKKASEGAQEHANNSKNDREKELPHFCKIP